MIKICKSFDEALAQMEELVNDFAAQEDYFISARYVEQEARKDFIDKMMMTLGWDVNHDVQKNPYEQEVKVERGVTAQGRKTR